MFSKTLHHIFIINVHSGSIYQCKKSQIFVTLPILLKKALYADIAKKLDRCVANLRLRHDGTDV